MLAFYMQENVKEVQREGVMSTNRPNFYRTINYKLQFKKEKKNK